MDIGIHEADWRSGRYTWFVTKPNHNESRSSFYPMPPSSLLCYHLLTTLLTARWPLSRSWLSAPVRMDGFVDHLHHAQLAITRREWSMRGEWQTVCHENDDRELGKVKENSTSWKWATMNVVARFCLFLTLLTTFQSNVHTLNGNDDDKNGQTAARQPKWQPGGPDDVCTRLTQPRKWEAHLPNKHQLQTPTWHFRWHRGAATQQHYVKWYEAVENRAPPCWVTWRCKKPNAQCPPVEWHEGKSWTWTCWMIQRHSKPKPTNWMTQRHSNPPQLKWHEGMEHPLLTLNHIVMDGYWSRAASLCTVFFIYFG